MTLYDNYHDLVPTPQGGWLKAKRAGVEWKLLCRHNKNIQKVLESGPGHGAFASLVVEDCRLYVAVESNWSITQMMADRGYRVCRAVAPPLPLSSSSMDLVYASHVVEHLADPATVLRFIQEAYRVLRPNGLLVLSAPDLLAFGKAFWDADYTHTFPVTERRLRQLLSDGQFEIVQTINIAGPIRGPLSHILSCLAWFMPTNLVFVSQNTRTRLIRLRLTFLRNICVIARKGAKSDR